MGGEHSWEENTNQLVPRPQASDSGVPAGAQRGEDGGLTLPDGRDPLSQHWA